MRTLRKVAATGHVGGWVVGPKPGAWVDVPKPTARQSSRCLFFFLLFSVDSPAIAQRPGPTCGVAGVAPSQVLEAWGRLSPALPVATLVWEPLRFLVAFLVREPRAECQAASPPSPQPQFARRTFCLSVTFSGPGTPSACLRSAPTV